MVKDTSTANSQTIYSANSPLFSSHDRSLLRTMFSNTSSTQLKKVTAYLQSAIQTATITDISKDIQLTAKAAQRKLEALQKPLSLRLIDYVRLCCLTMYKLAATQQGKTIELCFRDLLTLFFSIDKRWWNECEIASNGRVSSKNPELDLLFRLLHDLLNAVNTKQAIQP